MADLPNYSIDLSALPTYSTQSASQPNPITGGLAAGWNEMVGTGGAALSALGRATGLTSLEQYGADVSRSRAAQAQASGRPDLEENPWSPSGIAYQLAKAAPTVGGMVIGGLLMPEVAVPGAVARVGAMLPGVIGGGALEAGAGFAARRTALETGEQLAKHLAGATAVGYPLAAGAAYEQALNAPGGPTTANAYEALAAGVPLAALGGLAPTQFRSLVSSAETGTLTKRVLTGMATAGPVQGVAAGVQTAVNQQFGDPNKTAGDRAHEIVQSVLSGALVGGVIGGVAGAVGGKRVTQNASTDDLKAATETVVPPKPTEEPGGQLTLPGVQQPQGPVQSPLAGLSNGELMNQHQATQGTLSQERPVRAPDQTEQQYRAQITDFQTQQEQARQQSAQLLEEMRQRSEALRGGEGQQNLFTPAETGERAGQVQQTRDQLVEIAPTLRNSNFIKNLNAVEPHEVVDALRTEINDAAERGTVPKGLTVLAERFGVTDAQNNDRNLAAESAKLNDQVEKQWATAKETGRQQDAVKAQKLQKQRDQIDQLIDWHKQADNIASVRELVQEQQRKQQELEATADENGQYPLNLEGQWKAELRAAEPASAPNPLEAPFKLGDTEEPQLPLTITADDRVARGLAFDIAGANKWTYKTGVDAGVPGLIDRVVNTIETQDNPPVSATKIAKEFGLVGEDGKTPVPLEEAIFNAQTAMAMRRAQLEQLPPNSPRSSVDALNTELTRLDRNERVLNDTLNAREAREPAPEQPAVQPEGAVPEPPVGQPVQATDYFDRQKFNENLTDQQKQTAADWSDLARDTVQRRLEAAPGETVDLDVGNKVAARMSNEIMQAHREQLARIQDDTSEPIKTRREASKLLAGEFNDQEVRNFIRKYEDQSASRMATPEETGVSREVYHTPDTPDWAVNVARGFDNGRVVYHDGDHALVKAYNSLTGRAVYLAADRETGRYTRVDVDAFKGDQLSPETLDKLRAEKQRLVDLDQQALKANPDGPFKDADSNVVSSVSVDQRLNDLASNLMRMIGFGNIRTFIFHPEDIQSNPERYGLNGDYGKALSASEFGKNGEIRAFGDNGKDFYIMLKSDMSPEVQVETLTHEIGHMIQRVSFDNASPETQAAIKADFNKWLKSTETMNAQEVIRSLRNSFSGEEAASNTSPTAQLNTHYWKSFSEWFADNVSKWATTDQKPMSLVEKFFSTVAQKFRDFVSVLTGRPNEPAESVRSFLNSMGEGSAETWLSKRVDGKQSSYDLAAEQARAPKTPQQQTSTVRDFAESATRVGTAAADVVRAVMSGKVSNVTDAAKRFGYYTMTSPAIARLFNKYVPSATDYINHMVSRTVIQDVLQQPANRAQQAFNALPEAAKNLTQKLMRYTVQNIDPRKPWADQPWLHESKNADVLTQEVARANAEWGQLVRMKATAPYEMMRLSNVADQYANMTMLMYNHVMRQYEGRPVAGFETNPVQDYQLRADLHDSPEAVAKFWQDRFAQQRAGADAFMRQVAGEAASLRNSKPAEARQLETSISPLRAMLSQVDQGIAQTQRAPYFRVGRYGDYFVAGKLLTDESGKIDGGTVDKVQDALTKTGFGDLGVHQGGTTPSIFVRVENLAQARELGNLFRDLQKQGVLDKGEAISEGLPGEIRTLTNMAPEWLNREIEAVKTMMPDLPNGADPKMVEMYEAARHNMVDGMVQQWLSMLPDNSINRVMQRREGVLGYNTDMARNFATRSSINSRAVSSVGMSLPISRAVAAMRDEVQTIKSADNIPLERKVTIQRGIEEMMLREAQRQWNVQTPIADMMQGISHVIYVGSSPAYTTLAMSQIPTLSWPELARNHGYMKSALALGRAANPAFQIMRAVFNGPDASNVGFSLKTLLDGGVSKRDADFIMRQSNLGNIGAGTYTRATYQLAEGSSPAQAKAKQWASAMGSYAEMYPRVITALAARDLYEAKPVKGMTMDEYVTKAVRESQFDWNPAGNPRISGKMGLFGPMSKVMLQFTGFQTRMLEKYHHELLDLFGRNGPEARKEAATFLGGHLAAGLVLAGSLGLPAAGWLAGAADKLANTLTGRDDFDVQASYRTWLAQTFGKDVGEVLARGAPRALGFDMSHVGDQNIIPGTQFMQEKRKFEDAEADWMKSVAGSSIGLFGNAYLGARDIANGDYLVGLQKIVPTALKGPIEAMRMTEHGYEDRKGVQLPLTPTAREILQRAIGFEPARLADYNEAKRTEEGLTAAREYREQNISRHLSLAMEHRNSEDLQYWVQQAAEYARQHPGMPGPITTMGQMLQRNATSAAMARALGMPVGTKITDFSTRALTGYGNY